MQEFSVYIECPHCGHETHNWAEFNFDEADQAGCNSRLIKDICNDCDKEFWFKAYLSFDVEAQSVFKKKPKDQIG